MSSNRPQRKITNSFQGFKSLPLHTFPLDKDLNNEELFFSIGERKQMKKTQKGLAIAVIFLFIGVALAPSINFTVVKASNDNDLVEVTINQDFNRLNGNETPLYPKLLAFVVLILWLKLSRGSWFYDHSIVGVREQMYITHPLLLLRGMWLIWKATGWASFWMFLATVLGWNWSIEDFLNPSQSNK